MDCKKKSFTTKKEAKQRAGEINRLNNEQHKKIKLRAYKCENCEFWHLTSMNGNHYKYKTDLKFRNKVRERNFILRESQHWNKRFGILDY